MKIYIVMECIDWTGDFINKIYSNILQADAEAVRLNKKNTAKDTIYDVQTYEIEEK